jgi:inner membrane protein
MLAPNHIAGGFVFTGLFASFAGENIFASPYSIALAVVASLAPDIDNPRSPVGLTCLPLSRWINRRYGHRTVTHSLTALAVTTIIFQLAHFHPLIWFFGFLSHLIFDMVTIQGVPLFHPFANNPCVIPGRKELRMQTGDMKAESMTFAGFLLIGATLQPMMKNGFWTTYNSQFGTQKHLASEYQKSKDLMEVTYNYMVGSEVFTGKGFCVEADEKKTVLWERGKWLQITPDKMNVKQITFTHTQKPFTIKTLPFIQISVDSLNSLVSNKPVTEAEILCNQTARVSEALIIKDFKNYKEVFPYQLLFSVKDTAMTERPFFALASVSSKLKRHQIQTVKEEYEAKRRKWENNQIEAKSLLTDTSTNYIQRERNLKRLNELRNERPPELDVYRIQNLEYEALIAEQQDAMQTQIEYQKYLLEQSEKRAKVQTATFSGYIKILSF